MRERPTCALPEIAGKPVFCGGGGDTTRLGADEMATVLLLLLELRRTRALLVALRRRPGAVRPVSVAVALYLVVVPLLLLALTRTRTVRPVSAAVTLYLIAVAPAIERQFVPAALQRCHWKANLIRLLPDHFPLDVVNARPTRALPEIAGREIFTGAAVLPDCPTAEWRPCALAAPNAEAPVAPAAASDTVPSTRETATQRRISPRCTRSAVRLRRNSRFQ